jgi:diguanylate cyclase (GGDEF)-like protein
VNQPASKDSVRPTVLLLGDASARPTGLEQALTRAGFQLVEQGNGDASQADAILVTLVGISDTSAAALIAGAESNGSRPPRFVVLSANDPDGPAAALALGATDALAAPVHLPELCARLLVRIRERRSASGQDSALLAQRIKEEFERARRYSLSFSLILLAIDDLGGTEEQNRTDATVRLRAEVTRTLRRELRAPDLVVPFSLDEFAIVLPETGEAGARQSVFRLRERLTSLPFEGDPRLEPTRFSAGIVTYPHPAALETDDLFAMAEAALMRGRAQAGERIGIAM